MFKAEFRDMKSGCWASAWRPVGNDGTGRPTHYVALSEQEMFIAAATGRIDIPDAHMPAAVIAQRDAMARIAGEMGLRPGDLPGELRDQVARLALEELAAA